MTTRQDHTLAELFRAANAGDERAYAEFLRLAAGLVRGFARGKCRGGEPDPEDVVQETLLAVHLKRHTWEPTRPVAPWLIGIARYKLIDGFRRRGRMIPVDLDDVIETLAAPEPETASPLEVNRALDALSAGQRSVVTSISLRGQSISATAAELNMSEGAVRVALHRGLAAIAKAFGKPS